MMGKRKAAVLPEPVWAQAIKSRDAITMGMAFFWTGVGLSYLQLLMFLSICDRRPLASKDSMGLTGFSPDTLTGTF